MDTIIIGCGVSGLTTGVRLLEAGCAVTIWARDLPPNTTSNVAAAIWHPFKVYPMERVVDWSARSFEVFSELASSTPQAGVRLVEAVEMYGEQVPDPEWKGAVRQFRRAGPADLPEGYRDGFVFGTPVIETPIYINYLLEKFASLGGRIIKREVASLSEALEECCTVVNCTGLGSRQLLGDEALYPIRGQIVRVERNAVSHVVLDEDEQHPVTYIIPRSNDCILGGTTQVGDWSLEPDMAEAEAIMVRCAILEPGLGRAKVLGHLVGLRPGRSAVRLEAEPQPGGGLVVHNYGHGGAGVTLSWGCAEEVVSLVEAAR